MDVGGAVAPDADIAHNVGDQSAHLSDVFEVISANDPTFGAGAAEAVTRGSMAQAPGPYAFISEQPAPKALRFRYECEGRSAGSIPGINSTPENKTYPTLKVCGYKGCMVVVVSCVTKEEPYKPHPHNLVGRDCTMGVCTVKVKTEGDQDFCNVVFKNLGIQCVKRRDIAEALRVRQEIRVNPFKTGYAHRSQPQSIDLNAVRLCFQVFLTDEAYKVQHRPLPPIVSEVIYDKKAMSDLMIVRTSHCTGTVRGGTTVILLCEKVTREDTEVWFYREENGAVVWTDRGHIDFVHKQLAIVLKTPPYADQHINDHVTVQMQLQRLSDGAKSNTFNFEYFPEAQDKEVILGHKRRKKLSYNLSEYGEMSEMAIKAEPRDRTPPHPMGAVGYGDQQWAAQHWASPPYVHSPSPHLQAAPAASPLHHQVLSPEAAAPTSPYQVHMLSPHHMQPSTALHMASLGVRSPAVSPGLLHAAPAPALSPNMSPGLQQNLSPGLQQSMPGPSTMQQGMLPGMQSSLQGNTMQGNTMQGNTMQGSIQGSMQINTMQGSMMAIPSTMDPVMGDVGQQQPIYTQMETSTLSGLLAGAAGEAAALSSGELSFLLAERHDLSDSLTRLTTRDHPPDGQFFS